jgi:tetratricopeptide (TPR) repeat protein
MKYNDYVDAAEKGGALAEKGDLDEAIIIFKKLAESDLSTTDRSLMCLNVAKLYNQKGDQNQALVWYTTGADLESRHNGFFVREHRAAYLAHMGRADESLIAYEQLLGQSSLAEAAKLRIQQNIAALQKKAA